jgi:Leucine-rich repeat (LRR) protein
LQSYGYYSTSVFKDVDLSNKKLDRIDKNAFDQMNQIENLGLNKNNLVFIENRFNKLKNLKSLDLSFNLILTIYYFDFNTEFNNFQELNLGHNSIESIEPDSFVALNQLKKLYLNMNYIRSVNGFLNGLNNLQTLDLSSNEIIQLNNDDFNCLEQLEDLYLNSNQIEMINNDFFQKMIKLKILRLNSNYLKELDPGLFCNLVYLYDLNLGMNKLSIISSNIFNRLESLERLDLSDNNINLIHRNAFTETCNIDLILLDGNPIYGQFEYTKEDCLNDDHKETELLSEEEIR